MYLILFVVIALVSYLIQNNLKKKFKTYSRVLLESGLSGKDVAEKMLYDNGIIDVKVISIKGKLTDNYNPIDHTVNLSEGVYASNSVAAAAVAAHECGHAIQNSVNYAPLKMRSALVPIVSFSSTWMPWILFAGILSLNIFPQLLLLGIILFATTTLFSFVTLPVEIDASVRATKWLESAGITNEYNHPMAIDALKSAAYTYVVAALSSLAILIYYVLVFLSGQRDD